MNNIELKEKNIKSFPGKNENNQNRSKLITLNLKMKCRFKFKRLKYIANFR